MTEDHDADYDALATQLEEAGLAERFTDEDGTESIRLTPKGEQAPRQLAMSDEGGQDALMEALLGDT